jgi:hypothetical protein
MMASEYQVHLRKPHTMQREFIESTAKRKVIRAGRRGGKTCGIAILAVKAFLAGRRVLYATPTQEQVVAFWHEVKRALAGPIDAGMFRSNESTHTIELPKTQQRIRAKTAWNSDTLRGDFADLLIMDEFQLMAEDAWDLVGAPMLMDNDGDAVFIYTPPSLRSRSASKAIDKRHAAKMFKKAEADTTGRWATFHFASAMNPHISKDALAEISQDMTAIAYRQEIEAEDIEDAPVALWNRGLFKRLSAIPADVKLVRCVVGVDPTGSVAGDEAGIVTDALGSDGNYYLLADNSRQGSPEQWARSAINAYEFHKADKLVAESNYGGDMVKSTIRNVKPDVPVLIVHASRGKAVRAEPIVALYEQGKVIHVGNYPELEDEMCQWDPGDSRSKSPNRIDAHVWAMTYLAGKLRSQKKAGVYN